MQLPNYLRAYRKRCSLLQREISFLIGHDGDDKITRYECFHRVPTLATALALEAVFGVSAKELFRGLYHKAEKQIANRALILIRRVSKEPSSRIRDKKLIFLREICARAESSTK